MANGFQGAVPKANSYSLGAQSNPEALAASAALQANASLAICRLRCEVDRGVATLYGQVPTHYLKQLAQETVRRSGGIKHVVNEIVVRRPKPRTVH